MRVSVRSRLRAAPGTSVHAASPRSLRLRSGTCGFVSRVTSSRVPCFPFLSFFGSRFLSPPHSSLSCPFPHCAWYLPSRVGSTDSWTLPSASFLMASNCEALSHVPLSYLKSFANCSSTTTKLRSSHFGDLGLSLSCSVKPQFPHVYQAGGPGGHRLLFSQDPSGRDSQ